MVPMAWSKDSAFLAYVFGQSGSLNDLRLYNVASDLTSKLYSCEGLASPSFSPDATQIAFVCYENGFANRDILILTVGQRTQIKVYGEPGVFIRGVAWGKNNQLALVTDKSGHDEIYLLNAFNPGGTPAQLTNTKGASLSPAWSPDGTKIAFTSNRDGADKIYVMNADGSDARALHDGSAPSWSPDGQWIAFQLSGNIFIMDAFGGHVTQITNDGGANPAWSR
jgi:TolB protein